MTPLFLFDIRVVLITTLFLIILSWLLGRSRNYLPPGPVGFPIVGSVPALVRGIRQGLEPHHIFGRYAAQYGSVFSLRVLNKTLVVLNDYASIKEAFQHPQLNDRPKTLGTEVLKVNGIAWASGKPWVELRRFCMNRLKSSSFEEKIAREADGLVDALTALDGGPFDPRPQLGNAVANVICSVLFGKRYEYSDREFTRLLALLGRSVELLGAGGAINFFPGLRHLPFLPVDEVLSNSEEIMQFLSGIIKTRGEDFHAECNMDYTTDAYHSSQDSNSSTADQVTNSYLTERNILGTVSNLFAAGSETTSTTLQWCLLYMIAYPDVQQRVQAELDTVVGRHRLPVMSDRPELNLTQSVIWEVQRSSSVLPLGVPHSASSDTLFHGYLIPKGSILIGNLWAVLHDAGIWTQPELFDPGRFLGEDGKAIRPHEFIPFGIGRRVCLGDRLARMELFLFFSRLMHQFTIKNPADAPPPSLKGKAGITFSPASFKLCATRRH